MTDLDWEKRPEEFALRDMAWARGCGDGLPRRRLPDGEPWTEDNVRVIQENGVQGREREVPDLDVRSNLEWDKVYPDETLPKLELAPGVTARAAWGQGTLYEYVTLEPGAVYPEETLTVEAITTVRAGRLTLRVDEEDHTLAGNDVIYLAEGTRRRLEAGAEGAELVEVFFPSENRPPGVGRCPGRTRRDAGSGGDALVGGGKGLQHGADSAHASDPRRQ